MRLQVGKEYASVGPTDGRVYVLIVAVDDQHGRYRTQNIDGRPQVAPVIAFGAERFWEAS